MAKVAVRGVGKRNDGEMIKKMRETDRKRDERTRILNEILSKVSKMLKEQERWDWLKKVIGVLTTLSISSFLYYIWPRTVSAPQFMTQQYNHLIPPLSDLGLNNLWGWIRLVGIVALSAQK